MTYCYAPSILLFILGIYVAIEVGKMWWGFSLVFGSIPLMFAIIAWILCKKGYTIMAWLMLCGPFIVYGMIATGVIRIRFLESTPDNIILF